MHRGRAVIVKGAHVCAGASTSLCTHDLRDKSELACFHPLSPDVTHVYTDCVVQEGLPFVINYLTKRVVEVNCAELCSVVHNTYIYLGSIST